MPAHADAAFAIEAEAQRQKTLLLYRNAGIAQAVNIVVAALVAYINATLHASPGAALAWCSLVVAIAGGRYALARRFLAAQPDASAAMAWRHRYLGSTVLLAATWGAGVALFMWNAPEGARLFTGLALAGMVAGAVPILAPVPVAFRAFAAIVVVPMAAVILLQADSALDWAFGSTALVFLAAMLASARHLHQTLDLAIRLGLEKDRLLGNLERAGRAAETALEASNLSLWDFDIDSGRVYLDENWAKIVGGEGGERVARIADLTERVHPDDRERIARLAIAAIKGITPSYREEIRVQSASGDWKWIVCRGKVVDRNADGWALRAVGTSLDITERKRAQMDLQESEARFRDIVDYSPIGMVIASLDGRLLQVNRAMCSMLGYTRGELEQLTIADITHPDDRAASADQFQELIVGKLPRYQFEKRYLRKDGEPLWAKLTASMLRHVGNETASVLGQIEDITESRLWRDQMYHQAYYDPLTDLPNRRLLLDRVNQALAEAHCRGRSAAVLFLDLDRFKAINDSLGHDVGDQLLKEVAKRLQACVRRGDTVSRQGGDEFVIVLTDMEQPQDAARVSRKILEALSAPIRIEGPLLTVTTSIGISLYPSDATDDGCDFIKKADEAMYAAKQSGRNRFHYYHETVASRASRGAAV